MINHKLAPPLPTFCAGYVSEKVWPTLVNTQHVGIYPKILLGFATFCTSSPASIYHILSVKLLICNEIMYMHYGWFAIITHRTGN